VVPDPDAPKTQRAGGSRAPGDARRHRAGGGWDRGRPRDPSASTRSPTGRVAANAEDPVGDNWAIVVLDGSPTAPQ